MSAATLLREARLDGAVLDVLVEDGVLTAIGPDLEVPAGAEIAELDGRPLLPGLWDNHVHFDQWALARTRLDLAAATSAAAVAELVAARLRADPPAAGTPLVGAGFRDALWPDRPHRALLDAVSGPVPVVLVAADLHCCWLNSAAADRYGHAANPTGLVRESDWHPIMNRIRELPRSVLDGYAADAAAAAAARGVVGIVDFESPWQLDAWSERIGAGLAALRVVASVWPSHLHDPIARGLRTGDVIAGTGGLLTMGPLKVVTDGSLNTRTAYCHDPYPASVGADHPCGMLLVPPEELEPLLGRATAAGLDCAVHAIGDHANELALNAFAAVGARGRVEHAQLLTPRDVGRFAELGVVASVQPEHAIDDRDVADHYWAGRTHRAFAYRSLLAAGAELALGSDAPVAPLDPWITLAAAVHRSADERPSWHGEQEIELTAALAASAGAAGPVAVGRPADLVVTELDPGAVEADRLRAMPVAATMLGGRWTHRTGF
ncbi:MAG TPA: amidohydrolase family protein [Pseudonocardia sp.]|nr:amidohydrolase family protein [Pseudonocardia sp.]